MAYFEAGYVVTGYDESDTGQENAITDFNYNVATSFEESISEFNYNITGFENAIVDFEYNLNSVFLQSITNFNYNIVTEGGAYEKIYEIAYNINTDFENAICEFISSIEQPVFVNAQTFFVYDVGDAADAPLFVRRKNSDD